MAKRAQPINFQKLSDELEQIMVELQRDDLDIDVALKQYERGLVIIKDLEAYLKLAENMVSERQTKFSA